ncbi:unnamed protein product [Cylindrotheca closterium]|uniref:Uncharacterized protein n=1 Tax=Cylindrotheca closterium TaxID=2856 RepID=A0AAD2JLD6_9STRA|nr:unnamed protein product [Cylindrotheca closterium]
MKALPANLQCWTPKHISSMTGVRRRALAPDAPPAQRKITSMPFAVLLLLQLQNDSPSAFLGRPHRLSLGPAIPTSSNVPSPPKPSLGLGAQGLLEDLVSPNWRHLQALHFSYIGSKKSANLWASRLIQQLIRIGHYMWKDLNRLAHSEDSSWYTARKREIDIGIRKQFAMGLMDIPQRSQYLFCDPQETVLNKSLEDHQHWLRLVSRERAINRRSLARQHQMIFDLARPANQPSTWPTGANP